MSRVTASPTTAMSRLGASYWRLWSAASLSSLADGTFKITLPLLASAYTRTPLLVAGVGFAAMAPWLLFSLPAGAIADRADRRRVMLTANLVRMTLLAAAGVLAVAGIGSIEQLYLVAFGAGIAETLYEAAAQAIVPRLVGPGQLDRANALQQIASQAANQFAGPAFGGLLVGAGVAVSLGAPALAWAFALATLARLPGTFRAERNVPSSLRADITEGLRFLWTSTVLRSVSACAAISNFAGAASASVFVLYAVGPGSALGLTPAGFGLLLTASAVGSVVGALRVRAATRRLGHRKLLAINSMTQVVLIVVPVLTHNVVAIGLAYALGGFGVALWNVGTVSLRQRLVPERLLGRVISTHRLISWGSLALGALAGGVTAQLLGLVVLFWASAAMTLLGVVALIPVPRRIEGSQLSPNPHLHARRH
jgi:MFS family permease